MIKTLLVNRFITPDGTVLYSHHCHDFVSHVDANGETYYTDGGNEYIRTTINVQPMEDKCLYTTDSIDDIREVMEFEVRRDGVTSYILLKDLAEFELLDIMEKYDPEVCHNDCNHGMFITLARELVCRNIESKMEREHICEKIENRIKDKI